MCISIATPSARKMTSAIGGHLEARLRRFAGGEELNESGDTLFEEVAAVIEGAFHVDAAGESYDLSAGEGIVIPPGEPRAWRCDADEGGLLYRVLVRVPGVAP